MTGKHLTKTRRSRDVVIKNACAECRKRKARCDGQNPCARCLAMGSVSCQYAVSIRASKEAMRTEIEGLQAYRQISENILSSLASGNQLEFILQCLRDGFQLHEISNSIGCQSPLVGSESHTASWNSSDLSLADSGSSLTTTSSWERPRDFLHAFRPVDMVEEGPQEYILQDPWTEVTSDDDIIENLLSMYFCWEFPNFIYVCKKHFFTDFKMGRRRYCSPLLVNAMLALGARFTDQPEIGGAPNENDISGYRFYAEAERLWAAEQDQASLTTIQALGLMSYWEQSCGNEDKAWFFSRLSICMAIEMGLHLPVNVNVSAAEQEMRTITFWGAFALDQVWSLSLGRIPAVTRNAVRIQIPDIAETEDQSEWVPYTDNSSILETSLHQPSNVQWVYKSFCKLSMIIHDSLYALYSPGKPLISRTVLGVYTQYLQWYDSLPVALRRGENSTPAVLLVHMYYHYAIILLLAPFMRLRFIGSSISAAEICVQAAHAISSLVHSYRQLYCLRRTPALFPYIVLASAVLHLAVPESTMPSDKARTEILKATANLQEMAIYNSFARRANHILQTLMHNWSVGMPQASDYGLTKEIDHRCQRGSFPINFFSLDIEGIPPSKNSFMEISIFSPFPTQVIPLAALKEKLERYSFCLL